MWNPKQNNLYQTCKNTHKNSCRAFVSSVVFFRREKAVFFVLFCLHLGGILYIFPLKWVGGYFWYFLSQISLAQPAELATSADHIPCLIKMTKKSPTSYCVPWGLSATWFCYHWACLWREHEQWSPSKGVLQYLYQETRNLYRKSHHFLPLALPVYLPLPPFLFCFSFLFVSAHI